MSGTIGNTSARVGCQAARGFTLIELMIVVAILGVLMAIALPSYRSYVIRGSLTDAATGLTSMRADMEAYYQNFRTYAAANGGSPPCVNGAKYGKFTIGCDAPAANGYLLRATSTDNLLKNFQFTVDQADRRQTVSAPAGWIGGGAASCATRWVLVKGEAC